MNVDELINDYFNLSDEQKEDLLCVLIKDYFRRNLADGFSLEEIINGVDEIIEYSSSKEDYEMSQAFVDIKAAMKVALKELRFNV